MRIGKNRKSFVLLFSLIVTLVVILSVTTFFYSSFSAVRLANIAGDAKRAYYAADAGLTDAFMLLCSFTNPPASANPFVTNNNYSIGTKTGSYSVVLVKNAGTWPNYTMTSTGTCGNVNKILQLTVQGKSPSMYAYLSNTEIHPDWGRLWWITGMYTVGPVNTNGQLNIWGDPIFDGPVAQAAATINYWPGVYTDPADFRGGLTLGAPSLACFNSSILNNIQSGASSADGLLLSGDSAVTFNADGSLNVTNADRGWSNQNVAMPANKAIYVAGGSATVQGTLNGQATLGCDQTIYISGNLIYNSDPDPANPNPASTDLLALVANNDITVQAEAAPANLEIEAVMVALNGSFQVDNWWAQGKGTMLQYGSLINNYCGPTGVFDPGTGELYGGYMQLQYYDPKLKTQIPPWFLPLPDSNNRLGYVKMNFKELL